MKSFKQFREGGFDNADEINVKVKKKKKAGSKTPKNKKSGNVEVMPNIPDGKRGMTTNVTNESFLRTRFTISGAKVFEIRQRLQSSVTDYGGGVGLASYWVGSSIFTVVEIFKEN